MVSDENMSMKLKKDKVDKWSSNKIFLEINISNKISVLFGIRD